MFYIIKVISLLIFSPLLFVVGFLFFGKILCRNGKKIIGRLAYIFGVILFLLSCEFSTDFLTVALENNYKISTKKEIDSSDVYILLGGGIKSHTLVGNIPNNSVMVRLMTTAKLYHQNPKPIIITGGMVLDKTVSESSVYKKDLVAVGIPEENIILEERSRNTKENAIYTKEIMREKNYTRGLIVTSATHMTRSMKVFEEEGFEFYPVPCGFVGQTKIVGIQNFIPNYTTLKNTFAVLWEYFGMIYYKIRY